MVNPVCFKMHIAYSSIIHPWNLSNSFNSWRKTSCRWRGQRGEHLATIHKIVPKKNVYLSRSNYIIIGATIRISHTHLYMKRTSEAVGPRKRWGPHRECWIPAWPRWHHSKTPLGRRTFVKYRLPCLSSYKRDRKTKACDELMAWTPCTTSNMVEVSLASTEGAGWYVWVGKKYWRHFLGFLCLLFLRFIFSPFFWHIPKLVSSCWELSLPSATWTNLWGERWYDALMGFVAFVYQGAKGRKDVKGR